MRRHFQSCSSSFPSAAIDLCSREERSRSRGLLPARPSVRVFCGWCQPRYGTDSRLAREDVMCVCVCASQQAAGACGLVMCGSWLGAYDVRHEGPAPNGWAPLLYRCVARGRREPYHQTERRPSFSHPFLCPSSFDGGFTPGIFFPCSSCGSFCASAFWSLFRVQDLVVRAARK